MIKFKKIEHNVENLFPAAIKILKEDKAINVAYLFGSYAKGKASPLSDIDIALLLDEAFPSNNYFDKRLELHPKIAKILKTDEIDLVILNQASPVLAYNILKNGKVLFTKNQNSKVRFETKVISQYLDTQKMRTLNLNRMKQRLTEGTFGK